MRHHLLVISSAALLVAIIAQFYLAAFGAFGDRDATGGFSGHEWLARTALPVLAILVIVTAAVARLPRRLIVLSAIPLFAIVMQVVLFLVARAFGSETHPGGASDAGAIVLGFHALFGLAALAACAHLVHTAAHRATERRAELTMPSGTVGSFESRMTLR